MEPPAICLTLVVLGHARPHSSRTPWDSLVDCRVKPDNDEGEVGDDGQRE